MLKKILIGLAVVLGLLVVGGLTLPDAYNVSRTAQMEIAPDSLQPFLDDLLLWKAWAPWEKLDTTIVTTMGPITRGVGASQSWTDKSGGGRLEILVSQPGRVEYDVYFNQSDKPTRSILLVASTNGGSQVTWSMAGEMDMPVVGPYLAIFADRMIGPMFQQGLDGLKELVETP